MDLKKTANAEDDAKASLKKKRSSLKMRKPFSDVDTGESSAESTPGRTTKRVSFKRSSSIKPFVSDPDKNTIWDTTYEEVVKNTDSTQSQSSQELLSLTPKTSFQVSRNDASVNNKGNVTTAALTDMELTRLLDKENIPVRGSILDYAKRANTVTNSVVSFYDLPVRDPQSLGENLGETEMELTLMSNTDDTTSMEFTCQITESTKNVIAQTDMSFTCQFPHSNDKVLIENQIHLPSSSTMNLNGQFLADAQSKIEELSKPGEDAPQKISSHLNLTSQMVAEGETEKTETHIHSDAALKNETMEFTCQLPRNILLNSQESVGNLGETDMEFTCKIPLKRPDLMRTIINDFTCHENVDMEISDIKEHLSIGNNATTETDLEFICKDSVKTACASKRESLMDVDISCPANLTDANKSLGLPVSPNVVKIDLQLPCKNPKTEIATQVMCKDSLKAASVSKRDSLLDVDVSCPANLTDANKNLGLPVSPNLAKIDLHLPCKSESAAQVICKDSLKTASVSKRDSLMDVDVSCPVNLTDANKSLGLPVSPNLAKIDLQLPCKNLKAESVAQVMCKDSLITASVSKRESSMDVDVSCPANLTDANEGLGLPVSPNLAKINSQLPCKNLKTERTAQVICKDSLKPASASKRGSLMDVDVSCPANLTGTNKSLGLPVSPNLAKIDLQLLCTSTANVTKSSTSNRNTNKSISLGVAPRERFEDNCVTSVVPQQRILTPQSKTSHIPIKRPKIAKLTPEKKNISHLQLLDQYHHRAELSDATMKLEENVLYSQKIDGLKPLTPQHSFSGLKTPTSSFANINSSVDDTQHLINLPFSTSNVNQVTLPTLNLTNSTMQITASEDLRKLSHINDTYVLKKKVENKFENVLVKNKTFVKNTDDDSLGILNDCDLEVDDVEVKTDAKSLLSDDLDTSLESNSYEYAAITERLNNFKLKGYNFECKKHDFESLKNEVTKKVNFMEEFLRNRKFKPIVVPHFSFSSESEESDDDVGAKTDANVADNNLPNTDFQSLYDKVKKLEVAKADNIWKLDGIDGDFYYFSAFGDKFSLVVNVIGEGGVVLNVETINKLPDNADPLALFLTQYLCRKLNNQNHLNSALGNNYSILSLLDYLELKITEFADFSHSFRPLNKYRFKFENKSIVSFRIWRKDLNIVFEISVNLHNIDNISSEDIVVKVTLGEIQEDSIKSLINGCPKNLDFIKCFLDKIEEFLNTKNKKKTGKSQYVK